MAKLTKKSLNWALKSVERDRDTDVFPSLSEYAAIRSNWPEVQKLLGNQEITSYTVNHAIRELTPKRRYGYRISTQIHPLDHLFYTALVYEVGADLEATRVGIGKQIVHSYRWKPSPDGRFFNPKYSYASFSDRSRKLAEQAKCEYVVVTDIADFFTRLYLHRIERLHDILSKSGKQHHASAIVNLIKQWNNNVSYGIPVGNRASRILADTIIGDVDRLLLGKGIRYVRYCDDFRMFCRTKKEAYACLTFLAKILFDTHGLTLQEHKTEVVSSERFLEKYKKSEQQLAFESLNQNFSTLLNAAGANDYDSPDFEELDEETQEKIDSLNLEAILEDSLRKRQPDVRMVRWILQRLASLGVATSVGLVIEKMEKVLPALPEVVDYLSAVAWKLDDSEIKRFGKLLLSHINSGVGAYLPWHRAWILRVFLSDSRWNHSAQIAALWNVFDDTLTRRAVIDALKYAKDDGWFRAKKNDVETMNPWVARAFLRGATCLPGDEQQAYFKARKKMMPPSERLIAFDALK